MASLRSAISLLQSSINRLLPFATPGTPIVQDLLHLLALCTALYYAPQIQAYVQRHLHPHPNDQTDDSTGDEAPDQVPTEHNPPRQAEADDNATLFEPEQRPNNQDGFPIQAEQNPEHFPRGLEDDNVIPEPDEPGPANAPNHQIPRARTREVGAKKARSLARRDQRRAYHEFQRSQGDAQRAREAAEAEARAVTEAAERARRAAAEAEVRERERVEREKRRMVEEEERRREMRKREDVVAGLRREVEERGAVDVGDVARGVGESREWVERLVRASGILGEKRDGGEVVILTGGGWVVRVDREMMERVYTVAAENEKVGDAEGKVGLQELGGLLEKMVRGRADGLVVG